MTRVLILDDRPINRQFLSTLLAYRGFETREAGDGREGLAVARAWRPDLAIVDIEMPGMNGVEFIHQMRADAALTSTPIIFSTGSYEEEQADRAAAEWGIQYVLMKPSEPEVILAMVDRALGSSLQSLPVTAVDLSNADFVRLQSDALRMAALIEFQLAIAEQNRPADILRILSRAARNIVASQYSVVAMFDAQQPFGFSSWRDQSVTLPVENRGWQPGCHEHLKKLMAENLPVRTTKTVDPQACAIWHIDVQNYLGVPVQTGKQAYGWVSLMNRSGAADYSTEDERIALTMAAQAALAYENLLLFEKLRASEQRFRTLVENSADGILVLDRDATILYASPAITRILGYEVDAVTGTSGLALVHPEDRRHVIERLNVVLDNQPPRVISEWRALHRNGSWRSIAALGSNAVDDPAIRGIILNYRDVTEHRRSAEALDRLWRQYELILNSIADGVLGIDLRGRIIFCNPAAAMMLGWDCAELVGLAAHETMHHSTRDGASLDRTDCLIHTSLTDGIVCHGRDELFWRREGTPLEVDCVATPMRDAEGEIIGAVEVFRDISREKAMKRQIEQGVRVDSLGRIAASVAHEFNNVLMGIQPFAEIIRSSADADEQLQSAASHIISSVRRGRGITQDIMRMTRTPEPALQSVDMTAWVEQIAAEIRALVGDKINIDVRVPRSGTLFARCDPAQMQQVLTNLALNGRDAMPEGGTLTLAAARTAKGVQLNVGDTGCGIAEETLPFIFEPLFTTKYSGTGLGLAVAQQLVVRNEGTITVTSSVGQGTRFQIDLREDSPPAVKPPEEARRSPPDFGVRRVVIVEDDPTVADGLSAMLEFEGVTVRVVNLGREAVAAVAAFEPDVVLIDIKLPDISGSEVYSQISAKWPQLPVVFSTGHADESLLPQSLSGRIGFLRKPYDGDTLVATLREVVSDDIASASARLPLAERP
ncbi:MAG TPA: response regulator [Thermoanaerobaculia bacterium]|nr:response regulator [Thermoanaerobaculia bacterium]